MQQLWRPPISRPDQDWLRRHQQGGAQEKSCRVSPPSHLWLIAHGKGRRSAAVFQLSRVYGLPRQPRVVPKVEVGLASVKAPSYDRASRSLLSGLLDEHSLLVDVLGMH